MHAVVPGIAVDHATSLGRIAMMAAISAAAVVVGMAPASAAEPVPPAALGCIGCHGPAGAGSDPIPPIAGRPADEVIATLRAFAAGQRPGTIMGRIVPGYTESEIAAIARYFAAPGLP